MNKVTDFPVKKKPGRPKGSKNKVITSFPITTEDMSKMTKIAIDQARDKELDKLKNLIGRQDDMIEQLSDEVKRLEKVCEGYDEDIGLLEGKIENYREILKTLLEITE